MMDQTSSKLKQSDELGIEYKVCLGFIPNDIIYEYLTQNVGAALIKFSFMYICRIRF
jgi:hypothetical protein